MTTRPLSVIADVIYENWTKPNYAAAPYLEAMAQLNSVTDMYGADTAKSVVAYFLSNASSWKGDVAKLVKSELKGMIK